MTDPVQRMRSGPRGRWKPRDPRRLLRIALQWLAGLAVFFYFAGSVAVWAFFRHSRGYQTIGYAEVVMPWRWHEVREKQGRELNSRAQALSRQGRYSEAFFLLKVGVDRAPGDAPARALLSVLYSGLGRPETALGLLLEGLRQPDVSPELVRMTCDLWFGEQLIEGLVAEAPGFVARQDVSPEAREIMALAWATALIARREFEQAGGVLASGPWGGGVRGLELRALLRLEEGRLAESLEAVNELLRLQPAQDSYLRLQARVLAAQGRRDQERSVHLARMVNAWDRPAIGVLVLEDLLAAGHAEDFRREFSAHLTRIRRDERACSLLAFSMAALGRPEDVLRARDASGMTGAPAYRYELAHAEALLRAGRPAEAATAIDSLGRLIPTPTPQQAAEISALRLASVFADSARTDRLTQWQLFQGESGASRTLLRQSLRLAEDLQLAELRGLLLERLIEIGGANAGVVRSHLRHLADRRDIYAFRDALQLALQRGVWDGETTRRIAAVLATDAFMFLPERSRLLDSMERLSPRRELLDREVDFSGWTPPPGLALPAAGI